MLYLEKLQIVDTNFIYMKVLRVRKLENKIIRYLLTKCL